MIYCINHSFIIIFMMCWSPPSLCEPLCKSRTSANPLVMLWGSVATQWQWNQFLTTADRGSPPGHSLAQGPLKTSSICFYQIQHRTLRATTTKLSNIFFFNFKNIRLLHLHRQLAEWELTCSVTENQRQPKWRTLENECPSPHCTWKIFCTEPC